MPQVDQRTLTKYARKILIYRANTEEKSLDIYRDKWITEGMSDFETAFLQLHAKKLMCDFGEFRERVDSAVGRSVRLIAYGNSQYIKESLGRFDYETAKLSTESKPDVKGVAFTVKGKQVTLDRFEFLDFMRCMKRLVRVYDALDTQKQKKSKL